MKLTLPPKMVERTLWAMWWLLLVVSSFWLMVGSVSYWVRNGFLPADASGWVQAVGAVVAIGVTVVIPLYQKAHDREARELDAEKQELARSEQLFALCTEATSIILSLDEDEIFADYHITNEMRRAVLGDLLARLNAAQVAELNPQRMEVGIELRWQLNDWLKYFGSDDEINLGRLHLRVNARTNSMESIKAKAENIVRVVKGLDPLALPEKAESIDDLF